MSALFRNMTRSTVDESPRDSFDLPTPQNPPPRMTLTEVDMLAELPKSVAFRNRDMLQHAPKLSVTDLAEVREKGRRQVKRREHKKTRVSKAERLRMERSLMDEHAMRLSSHENDEQRRLREMLFMLMQELPARQLLGVGHDVDTIAIDSPIAVAFNFLLEKSYLSAPVYDPDKQKYIGFLTLMDLVAWVVLVHHERSLQSGEVTIDTVLTRESSWQQEMRNHVSSKHGFERGRLLPPHASEILSSSDPSISLSAAIAEKGKRLVKVFAKRRPMGQLAFDASTIEAAHMLADHHRRIAIMSEDGNSIVGILSQSRFANFVAVEKRLWSLTLEREAITGSLADWGFNSRRFVKGNTSQTAIAVFELMNKANALALPIVDEESGALVAEILPEDLRGLIECISKDSSPPNSPKAHSLISLDLLSLPVLDFLDAIRGGTRESCQPTTVTLDSPFGDLFDLFRQRSIRRIYVLDNSQKPLMACSLKDAIAALIYSEADMDAQSRAEATVLSPKGAEVLFKLTSLCTISLSVPSKIVDFEHLSWLWVHLPATSRHKSWSRMFELATDGASLGTLLHNSSKYDREPMVTLVRDSKGFVFGCYTSEAWKLNAGVHGNGYCFVFSFGPEQKADSTAVAQNDSTDGLRKSQDFINVFKCEADFNGMMMYADSEYLTIGGGDSGAALSFDSKLYQGSSQPCDTFNSPCLANAPHFTVLDMEVWVLG